MGAKKKAYKSLGLKLKGYRLKKGLTQGEVAVKLKFSSPQFVSNWERGFAIPPIKVAAKLVDIYNLDSNDLVEDYMDVYQAIVREHFPKARGRKRQV